MNKIVIHRAVTVGLPGGNINRIKLIPIGDYLETNDDRRYSLTAADAPEVLARTIEFLGGRDFPVDYEHQIDNAEENGKPAPASGWIKAQDITIEADGIYGIVQWCDRARAMVEAKEYRYLSPTFMVEESPDGVHRVHTLLRAALVNTPAFDMGALLKQRLSYTKLQGAVMNIGERVMKALRDIFDMQDGTPEQMMSKAQEAMSDMNMDDKDKRKMNATQPAGEVQQTASQAVETIEAIAQPATAATAETTAQPATAATASQAETASGTAEVVNAATATGDQVQLNSQMMSRINELEAELASTKAEAAVDDAIKAGKVTPAMRDTMINLCKSNREVFDDYVEKAPVVLASGEHYPRSVIEQAEGATEVEGVKLTSSELAIASKMGVDPKYFARAKLQERGQAASQ